MNFSPAFLIFAVVFSLLQGSSRGQAVEVYLNNLKQEFDGNFKFPLISTELPDLEVAVDIFPRDQSGVVFQTHPPVAQPSYQSYGINGKVDKALGDVIQLGSENRRLESIDVTMVNWAKATDWPLLSAQDPKGYYHPLTAIVYGVDGNTLTLLGQETKTFLIPWRPAALDDGGNYPFGGIAVAARFDFLEEIDLPEKIIVLVAYNTESSGFEPIGLAGPYDQLNIGLSRNQPSVGSDDDIQRMIRFVEGVSNSSAFGRFRPMFTVRAFSGSPEKGTPLDAGSYLVRARIVDENYTGSATGNLEITPLEARVFIRKKRQAADGLAKEVVVETIPSGISYQTVYSGRTGPPVDRGIYPVFITLDARNYVGRASGTMRLGYSFESWIAGKIPDNGDPNRPIGREQDADLDGFTNFHEYYSATDPSDPLSRPRGLLQESDLTPGRMITVTRNNEAIDLSYILESSNDLGTSDIWQRISLPPENLGDPQNFEIIQLPFLVTPEDQSLFVRLGITVGN
jgi:hypothetical protein